MKKLILLAALLGGTAHAEFYDGNELLQKMDGSTIAENMVALGYVMGVADTTRGISYCNISGNITSGQMRDIVRNYLIRNPQLRHNTADTLVSRALGEVWPCGNRGNGRSL